MFGHAIGAAKIAAVRYRDAQIGYCAGEGVDQWGCHASQDRRKCRKVKARYVADQDFWLEPRDHDWIKEYGGCDLKMAPDNKTSSV